jgi:hypothetical protein
MANEEYLQILKQGVETWNHWRENNPEVYVDFSKADFQGMNLSHIDFGEVNLSKTDFSGANLRCAGLDKADLTHAKLVEVNLNAASLYGTKLNNARLLKVDLSGAALNGASLRESSLDEVNFSFSWLYDADFSDAFMGWTTFGYSDLSTVKGLDTIKHSGPSVVGIETLYNSHGQIPDAFLRGVGIPNDFIIYASSLARKAIEFQSCFISYSHLDEDFVRRLYSRMRNAELQVWFAPENIKGGQKLHEQIERAIQLHDRVLIVLSENSLKSEWVMTEIRKARKTEIKEARRKLFPIRLVDYQTIQEWECFDVDTGKDLAIEVREYFIPDFSNWKNNDDFEAAFSRLLGDLKGAKPNLRRT